MDWTHVAIGIGGMIGSVLIAKAPKILHNLSDWLKGHNHEAAGELLQELLDEHPNLQADLRESAKATGLDKNPVIAAALAKKDGPAL